MEDSCKNAILAVAVAGLLAACGGGGGEGGTPARPPLEDLNGDGEIVVLCFGDSITRGVGDGPRASDLPPSPAGYPERLPPLLAAEVRVPLTVIEDGQPSEQTRAGVARLRRDLGRWNADYAIILEGANDIQNGKAAAAIENIQVMVDDVFRAGAIPVLATLTPACCGHAAALPESAIRFYNNQLRATALNANIPLIDFYAAFAGGPEASYDPALGLIHIPEGLHPTPTGYDLMAETAHADLVKAVTPP